jgi:Zn-dependent protease with chaperone function
MIEIKGHWYDGEQSGQHEVIIRVDSHGYIDVLSIQDPQSNNNSDTKSTVYARQKLFSGQIETVKISSRLGNTSRYLYFPEGQKFETRENDLVDNLIKQHKPKKQSSFLYKLETHWRYVAVAVVFMIAVIYWSAVYGVPAAANVISKVMPDTLVEKAGEQTLTLLDKEMMRPSELDEQVQQRVRDHFAAIIDEHPGHNIQLHFRASDIGANALALPHGGIVFTDDMINLAENDDELLSVMAHEIGHVVHRHGMRGVIQGSIIGFILMMMTGDASAATELFLGLPVLLTQLGYSREFEREADDYALQYMLDKQLDPAHFSRLMSRLGHLHCDKLTVGNDKESEHTECEPEESWQRYFSTHPGLNERIEKFRSKGQSNLN